MTKHILRIVVTLIILAILGYVGWSYFFKPKDEIYVYSQIKAIVEKNDESNLSGSLSKNLRILAEKNYYGESGGETEEFLSSDEQQKELINLRGLIFGLSDSDLINGFYGSLLEEIDESDILGSLNVTALNDGLNEVLLYYFVYTQFAQNTTTTEINAIKPFFNEFNEQYNEINSLVKTIINYQKNGSSTVTINQQTTSYYRMLLDSFKDYLKTYANLNLTLKNYVISKVFENDFSYDFKLIYNDAVTYSALNYALAMDYEVDSFAGETFSQDIIDINKKLYEACLMKHTLDGKKDSGSNIDMVIIYNDLYENYATILTSVTTDEEENVSLYFKTNQQKYNIINNVSADTVHITEAYLTKVQQVLMFLGFTYQV